MPTQASDSPFFSGGLKTEIEIPKLVSSDRISLWMTDGGLAETVGWPKLYPSACGAQNALVENFYIEIL